MKMFKTWALATGLGLLIGMTASATYAQTANCIIASNDGRLGSGTEKVSSCRVNTSNGRTVFTYEGRDSSRVYSSRKPLTTRHLAAAKYWLERVDRLDFDPRRNPAGLNPKTFLSEASKATSGFVLYRSKKGRRFMNVVYITNGVYRSIDFPSTRLRSKPAGFLTTGRS